MDFGAFVTILPGKDGLVHISQISDERVEKVSDKLSEGDVIKVKVLEVDKQGRIRLSMKAVGEEAAASCSAVDVDRQKRGRWPLFYRSKHAMCHGAWRGSDAMQSTQGYRAHGLIRTRIHFSSSTSRNNATPKQRMPAQAAARCNSRDVMGIQRVSVFTVEAEAFTARGLDRLIVVDALNQSFEAAEKRGDLGGEIDQDPVFIEVALTVADQDWVGRGVIPAEQAMRDEALFP